MSVKVSIVVPAYNVEQYIEECIDSLLAQTLKEIEIVIVDDGSPDRSGEIADAYAEKDNRVKVIHQKNAGLGPARNSGMKVAVGEYIGFVDSDDWVQPDMYRKLYDAAVQNDADIVVSGHREVANGRVVSVKTHPMAGKTVSSPSDIMAMRNKLYGHDIYDKEIESFPMSVCMSIYRRKMLTESRQKFINILSEDIIFNLCTYKKSKVITVIDTTDYCYRKENQVSITQTLTEKKQNDFQMFLTYITEMANQESDTNCSMRAKRTAIDYCRTYVGLVEKSRVSLRKKVRYIKEFAENKEINTYWMGYPTQYLPIQQRIFHWMIESKCYGAALFLCSARDLLRQLKRDS